MEIEFQGSYDKSTLYKAVRLANKPSRRSSMIRIILSVSFIIVYIAYFFVLASKGSLSSLDLLRSGQHLLTLVILVYFVFLPYFSAFFTASRIWRDPDMRDTFSGYISYQGITYTNSGTAQPEIQWDRFAKKVTTADLLVVLTADGTLSFFPRRFFRTENDWNRVRQWVDGKISEAI